MEFVALSLTGVVPGSLNIQDINQAHEFKIPFCKNRQEGEKEAHAITQSYIARKNDLGQGTNVTGTTGVSTPKACTAQH